MIYNNIYIHIYIYILYKYITDLARKTMIVQNNIKHINTIGLAIARIIFQDPGRRCLEEQHEVPWCVHWSWWRRQQDFHNRPSDEVFSTPSTIGGVERPCPTCAFFMASSLYDAIRQSFQHPCRGVWGEDSVFAPSQGVCGSLCLHSLVIASVS